jgi:tetratricopeptide (TPR) repeat protein
MNRNQIESALFVFQLNTKLYPKSANVWDSLGEAYLKSNQKDKAIENYNKAIELDPRGATGDNARRMLRQIQTTQ